MHKSIYKVGIPNVPTARKWCDKFWRRVSWIATFFLNCFLIVENEVASGVGGSREKESLARVEETQNLSGCQLEHLLNT